MSRKKKEGERCKPGQRTNDKDNLDELFDMNIADARVQSQNPPLGVPRYRDPKNPFNTWSGKGRPPQWFRERLDSGIAPEQMEITGDDNT